MADHIVVQAQAGPHLLGDRFFRTMREWWSMAEEVIGREQELEEMVGDRNRQALA